MASDAKSDETPKKAVRQIRKRVVHAVNTKGGPPQLSVNRESKTPVVFYRGVKIQPKTGKRSKLAEEIREAFIAKAG